MILIPERNSVFSHLAPQKTSPIGVFVIISGLLVVITSLFYFLVPYAGDDWIIFSRVDWLTPYDSPGFFNPPWLAVVAPHVLLPARLGGAINRALIVTTAGAWLWKSKADWKAHVLVFTSTPFIALLRFNNIDYLPLIGLMLPVMYGLPFVAVKPQTAGAVALVWMKENPKRLIIPAGVIALASFGIWGFWPLAAIGNIRSTGLDSVFWNMSAWPISLVPGLWLLWQSWQKSDPLLAAAITPLLMPYINSPSLFVPVAILAVREDRAVGWWLYWSLWFLVAMG